MKRIVSFILMTIISMNYCFSNFPLEIFAQDKDINISSKQETKVEEKQQEKEKKDRVKLKLNKNLVNLEIGKEHKLDYEIISDSDKKDITEEIIFSTSDENIATVNKDGLIKAIDIGKVFINISIKDSEIIETCEVNIIGENNNTMNISQEDTEEIILEKEKSYEIINKSTEQIKLSVENNSYKYDKIGYSQNGTLQNTYKDTYGNIYLNESSKVKLGIKLQDIKFFVPIDQKNNIEVVEIEGPIIYEGVLESGKSYEIVNNTSNTYMYSMNEDKVYYDEITYRTGGDIDTVSKNDSGIISLPIKKRVGLKDKEYKYYMASELIDDIQIKEIEGPIIYEGVLESGKSYEIVNNTSYNTYMYSMNEDNVYYDEITYRYNGDIENVIRNRSASMNLSVDRKVSLKDKEYKYYIAAELLDGLQIKEIEGPIIYEGVLEAGKSYEIVNNTSYNTYMYSMNEDEVYYDEITYRNDRDIDTFIKNRSVNISLPVRKKVELKDKEYKYYMIAELLDGLQIKEIDEPVLYEFNLDKGSTYRIENTSNFNLTIRNNSNSNSNNKILYDYILYNKDGTYKHNYNSNGSFSLGYNQYIIISPSQDSLEGLDCYIPYEHYKRGLSIEKVSYGIGDIIDIMPKVEVNINKVLSKVSTSREDTTIKDTPSNYTIRVKNKTHNKYISISKIKNNYIILRDNDVNPYDELSIELSSTDTLKASVDVVLDANKQASKDISITQLGYIIANYNNKDDYTTRAMIFDENGKYIRDKSFVDNNKVNTGYLNEGKYTLILLKSDGYLWRLNNLSEFNERNLVQGKDYIKYNIDVKNGIINEINLDKIPILDEDRISFLQRNDVIFNTNTDSISVNGLIEVSLRYNFKDIYTIDDIKNIKMCFDLSKYAELVENSVVLDKNNVKYEITSDKLIIPVNKLKSIIKFFVRPQEGNRINLKSEATFSYNGQNIKEVLGEVKIDSNYITLNEVDKFTNITSNVHGITLPNTNVYVYQGSKKIGQTTSNSGGRWSARVTLPNAHSGSVHTIHAKINEGKDNEKTSNTINIKYEPKSPSIKKVEMVYKNKKYDLTRAITDGKQNVITIGTRDHKFTFIIEVENSESIKELYVTSTRNDVKKKLKATYDKENKKWIASGYFDSKDKNYIPRALSIEYSTNDGLLSVGKIDFESKEFKDSLPDEIKNSNVTIIDQDENGGIAKIELANKDKTTAIISSSLSKVNKDKYTEDFLTSQGYKNYGNGNWGKYEVTNTGKVLVIEWFKWSTGELYNFGMEVAGAGTLGEFLGWLNSVTTLGVDLHKLRELSYNYPEHSDTIEYLKAISVVNCLLGVVGAVCISTPWVYVAFTVGQFIVSVLSSMSQDLIEGKIPLFVKLLIDPSGYVYEAVDSNRIEGVTTTVYYQDENEQAVKWNAEEYDQMNPLITDKEGKYAWDVPEGLWQVKYEKEGYETTYSEWLPVPPPQTEVNIGIVSYEKPSIELFNIYEDRAEITFNKYIDVSTINTDSIELNDKLGNGIAIEIEPFEQEEAKDKKVLAKKFILKTNAKNTLSFNNEYTLTVKNTVKTYAGVNNDSDIIAKTTYKPLPTVIKVDDSYELNYGKEINIPVSIDNISNAEEFELTATSSMNDIVSIATNKVKFDKDGKAIIKAVGNLPGEAELTFKIEGTDLQATTNVNVILSTEDDLPDTPSLTETQLIGNNRYQTAIKVSNRGWATADNVVLVNSSAMVDALSATPFAKMKDAPILLTAASQLNNETKKEIERLEAKNVYIIGGTNSVSENIVSQLKSMNINVDRISGDNRYTTSLEIAKKLGNVSEIAVVNGVKGLADAVSIAPVAAERNMPIVLASPNQGTKTFDEFIKNNSIKTSYVIGGENSISKDVASKLPNSHRLGGLSRNETNAIILEKFYTNKNLNNIFVAKDGKKKVDDLIDALAVGVLAAKENSPLVIVGDKLDTKQEDVLKLKNPKEVTQVGGNGNENAFNQIVNMFKK